MKMSTGGGGVKVPNSPKGTTPASPIAPVSYQRSLNDFVSRGSSAPVSKPQASSKPKVSTPAPARVSTAAVSRRIAAAPAPVSAPSHAVNSTGQVVKPAPTPAPPQQPAVAPAPISSGQHFDRTGRTPDAQLSQTPMTIDQYLGTDTTYQSQLADLQKQLADYQANQQLQRSQYDQQYAQSLDQLNTQKGLDLKALADDYASRGLLQSGLYADALSNYNNQYAQQQSGLETNHNQFLDNLVAALNEFQTQQDMAKTNAQQEAAARRAAAIAAQQGTTA